MSKALFVEVVRNTGEMPAALREHAEEVTALEEHTFDASYIAFLDTQIRLSPRGPEWTQRLIRRRAALLPFCGVSLLRGNVRFGGKDYTVEIHPGTRAVIHWEEYDDSDPPVARC